MSKNICILELNMPGQSHSMVNSAFTKALVEDGANNTIVCMDNHFESLNIENSNIKHISFDSKSFKSKIQVTKNKLFAFLKVFKNLIKFIHTTKATSGRIVLLSVNEYELISLYFLHKVFPKARFTAVIHGNLNIINQRLGRNPYHNFFSYYHSIKRLQKTNVEIVVLEHWIKNNVRNNYPELASNIVVCPHPINEIIKSNKIFNRDKMKMGIAGILSPSKNISAVIELEQAIQKHQYLNHQAKIDYCMFLPPEYKSRFPEQLSIPLKETWLTNEQIKNFYLQVDFIIWFHGVEKTYLYSASGILLDAVKFNKPLIALSCPALTDFEATYGRISVSGDSIEEIINNLSNLSVNKYQLMLKNLSNVQQDRLTTSI